MKYTKLAILGGEPIRKKSFRSLPSVDDEELDLVVALMKKGDFSKFVGSPVEGTRELLRKKSLELDFADDSFNFLGGDYVRRFEAEWSRLIKADYCISVNSATSGLTAALLAAGIEPGDEVITTPYSFTATATSILLANAVPVFCDIDPETFCISPNSFKKSITPYTKCAIPVHWCGNAGDFDEIMKIAGKYNIKVIEDAAQAPVTMYKGRYLGTYGDAGVFSFNQPKNIMTGEGGMIVTKDLRIAEKCRLIRNHGESIPTDEDSDDYISNVIGCNFRLVEILAAIGYVQAKKVIGLNKIRSENYGYLKDSLVKNFPDLIIPQKITHPESYYAYTASFRWMPQSSGIPRNSVVAALRAEGIPVVSGIPRLMCDHPLFKRKLAYGKKHYPWIPPIYKGSVDYNKLDLPNARKLQEEYLGFFQLGWPNTREDMDDIINAFRKIMDNRDALSGLSHAEVKKDFSLGR